MSNIFIPKIINKTEISIERSKILYKLNLEESDEAQKMPCTTIYQLVEKIISLGEISFTTSWIFWPGNNFYFWFVCIERDGYELFKLSSGSLHSMYQISKIIPSFDGNVYPKAVFSCKVESTQCLWNLIQMLQNYLELYIPNAVSHQNPFPVAVPQFGSGRIRMFSEVAMWLIGGHGNKAHLQIENSPIMY